MKCQFCVRKASRPAGAAQLPILVARTGYSREAFANEILTEDPLPEQVALEWGIVHEIEGQEPACDPRWPDIVAKAGPKPLAPARLLSANFLAACRAAPAPDIPAREQPATVPEIWSEGAQKPATAGSERTDVPKGVGFIHARGREHRSGLSGGVDGCHAGRRHGGRQAPDRP